MGKTGHSVTNRGSDMGIIGPKLLKKIEAAETSRDWLKVMEYLEQAIILARKNYIKRLNDQEYLPTSQRD